MRSLQNVRTLCSPDSFHKESEIAAFQDEKFCDFIRYETWMNETVERLHEWVRLIKEYFDEFEGSWKYYAASKKMEQSVSESGLNDDDYRSFSILSQLKDRGRDIVWDTTPADVLVLCRDIIAVSHMDLFSVLKKFFGANTSILKEDDDGSLRPLTAEEHDCDVALKKVEAEDDVKRLNGIVGGLWGIFHIISLCNYDDDNKRLLELVMEAAQSVLDMDFNKYDLVFSDFLKSYNIDDEKTSMPI